ncbi:glycoside hydrolase family 127 protein [Limnovirga soli]|uniref:Glycoside hydrolase family 127 protein n=1 Tax=Limnovirga soli TaxID=2656915 RepID=A0A8J8JT82_9BACT|nr:glycoside hydrolase family 127 protein [Limnovirga soli]NNV54364.1 glycoside hydrolase family 127 protein [Limnovirga soli]
MRIILLVLCSICFCVVEAQTYTPEWNDSRMKVKPVTAIKAYAFRLKDVNLLPSLFTEAEKADVQYLLKIDPDRLLADFRTHAGLIAKGERYGGWESSGLAGHTLGHYLSALSLHYAASGNKDFLSRINYIVSELDECQKARKTGYIGAIPNEDSLWQSVENGFIKSRGFDLNGAWSPWYTVHKIMGGLLDAYLYAHNEKALAINMGIADWTAHITRKLNDSLFQKMLITEYGGMNDALVNTYAITGEKKYLDLSYKFYDRVIMDSLAIQKDILPGKHSNTQIPKVIGSARRYQLTGDVKDNNIAQFFWQTIVQHHSYATGGNSNYEYLSEPDKLNNKLTDNTTETCNTYNMLKLTGELFATAPSATLMDYYEKALYNHILASQNHQTGMTTYFVSLRMGGKKEYSDEYNTFTCCVGTGMENHVKYGSNIYARGNDGSLFINLFIPSILTWKEQDITLKMETSLPLNDFTTITINTKKAIKFPLRIRKPAWAKTVTLKVNGKLQQPILDSTGYLILSRQWANNDKIELQTALDLYSQSMPDNDGRKAIYYGPVLLAGLFGDKEPNPIDIPVFVTNEANPNKWLENATGKKDISFISKSTVMDKQMALIPFNKTADEYYTVYWDVFTPEQWMVQQKLYEAEKSRQKLLDLQTVDVLRLGEMQPERDHDLIAEKTSTGYEHNRNWRIADDSGFIAFNMKVDNNLQNTLLLTYWGMDNRGRTFDIYANDVLIGTEDLNKYKESKFYEIPYPIDLALSNSKSSIRIKLVPRKNNAAGPVYGAKIIKGDFSQLINTSK